MGFENIFSIQFVSFILLEIVSHGRWKRTREKERKIYFFFLDYRFPECDLLRALAKQLEAVAKTKEQKRQFPSQGQN